MYDSQVMTLNIIYRHFLKGLVLMKKSDVSTTGSYCNSAGVNLTKSADGLKADAQVNITIHF